MMITQGSILKELADVAFTALCAIQHFTKNPTQTRDVMERRARELKGRIHNGG